MIGTMLILMPFCLVLAVALLGIMLGSLGMDIHWHGSRTLLYLMLLCMVLLLFACVIAGIRLRITEKSVSDQVCSKPS